MFLASKQTHHHHCGHPQHYTPYEGPNGGGAGQFLEECYTVWNAFHLEFKSSYQI